MTVREPSKTRGKTMTKSEFKKVWFDFGMDHPHRWDGVINGYVAVNDRQAIIARHKQGEQKALYVTYGLGAYGLNLQYCHNVIFAEHSWDYAQRIQAEARIYRMGQSQDCYFYDIDCHYL